MKILLLSVLAVATIGLMVPSVFGQLSVETIKIMNGASNEGCQPDCFSPSELGVPIGTKIIFMNYDSTSHYSVSGNVDDGSSGTWASDVINPGSNFSITIDNEGKYDYYCTTHPWMSGKIIVVDSISSTNTTIPPLRNYMTTSITGDVDYIQIFLPKTGVISGMTIPIGIEFGDSVRLSGNPITISIIKNDLILGSKNIYPDTTNQRIISDFKLESDWSCSNQCSMMISYNNYSSQAPIFMSGWTWFFIPDKSVYLPKDVATFTLVYPDGNISTNKDTIQFYLDSNSFNGQFSAQETGFDTGIFKTSLSFVKSTDGTNCIRSQSQEFADKNDICINSLGLSIHGVQQYSVAIGSAYHHFKVADYLTYEKELAKLLPDNEFHRHLDGTSHTHSDPNTPHIHNKPTSLPDPVYRQPIISIQINGNNVDVTDATPFVANDDSIITFSGVVDMSTLSDRQANVITVQILSPSHNDIISIDQITPDQQGNFSLDIVPQGSVWNIAGHYLVKIFYGYGGEEHYRITFPGQSSQTESINEMEIQESITEEIIEEPQSRPILSFVDPDKDPSHYVKRYITEETYKDWFHENFPDYTIYEGIGITQEEYRNIVNELTVPVSEPEPQSQPEPVIEETIAAEPEPEPTTTQSSKGGGCLIATATFGSEMAPQVQFLREIRDNTVMSTQSGIAFMTSFNQFYYSFSPAIADYERENPVFKEMVKVSLTPLLASLTLLNYVDVDTEEEMLGYGIGIILLNVGMYFVAPAILVISLKKRFL